MPEFLYKPSQTKPTKPSGTARNPDAANMAIDRWTTIPIHRVVWRLVRPNDQTDWDDAVFNPVNDRIAVDPLILVRNILQTEWDPDNIDIFNMMPSKRTPRFTTGWYQAQSEKEQEAQVTITTPVENAISEGISENGTLQIMRTIIIVSVWSNPFIASTAVTPSPDQPQTPSRARGIGNAMAKEFAWQLWLEARRILRSRNVAGTQRFDCSGSRAIIDTSDSPVLYRRELDVEFTWIDPPPSRS